MLLFLVLDVDDDGYIQEKEWLELLNCIVLIDKKKSEKKKEAEVKQDQDDQASLKKSYDLKDEKQLKQAFTDSLQGGFEELGFIEFYNLISNLDIDPAKT